MKHDTSFSVALRRIAPINPDCGSNTQTRHINRETICFAMPSWQQEISRIVFAIAKDTRKLWLCCCWQMLAALLGHDQRHQGPGHICALLLLLGRSRLQGQAAVKCQPSDLNSPNQITKFHESLPVLKPGGRTLANIVGRPPQKAPEPRGAVPVVVPAPFIPTPIHAQAVGVFGKPERVRVEGVVPLVAHVPEKRSIIIRWLVSN